MTTSKEVATRENTSLTREQIDLIKHTVAIGATDNELKLFLYQAQKRGLDPLTRQIFFIKRKQYNPDTEKYEDVGTIQTGIDGFRVVADRTGKLAGILRGVTKDANGKLIGAWAEVYRSDWSKPAREEVSFGEYCQRKKDGTARGLWATMPETMIKKVAEAAALRMAFPEDLSGLYSNDEMAQADIELVAKTLPEAQNRPAPPSTEQTGQIGQAAPQQPVESEEAPRDKEPGDSSAVRDMAWFEKSLQTLQWANVGRYLRETYGVTGQSISKMIMALSPEQQEAFRDVVKNRLEGGKKATS